MRETLKVPAHAEQVAHWRIEQSSIVGQYVRDWLEASVLTREGMPYRIDLNTAMPQYLIDTEGLLAAEIRWSRFDDYLVEWIRSLDDLRRMDAAVRGELT